MPLHCRHPPFQQPLGSQAEALQRDRNHGEKSNPETCIGIVTQRAAKQRQVKKVMMEGQVNPFPKLKRQRELDFAKVQLQPQEESDFSSARALENLLLHLWVHGWI